MVLKCKNIQSNCSATDNVVSANPDIAGIGVIISFLVTTCLAFILAFVVMFLERYDAIRKFFCGRQPKDYAREPHMFWFKILSKNLLAFSDTQLLTGLAVQFTALLKHCELSIYHFQIVVELAFLTTVTHLLTLVALRNYFVKNRWTSLPRIILMLTNLGLLAYTSYIAYSYGLAGLHASSSLACFYQGDRPHFKAAFAGRWGALLIGAIGGHVSVMVAMYFLENKPEGRWLVWWGAIQNWIIAPIYAIYGLVFGGRALSKTQALGTPSVTINGSEKEWGFGQFLPVLLLALPLLAGWESFWEEYEKYHPEKAEEQVEEKANHDRKHSSSSRNIHRNVYEMKGSFSHINPVVQHASVDNSILEGAIENNNPSPSQRLRPSPLPSPGLSPSPRPSPQLRPGPSPISSPKLPTT